jgi:tetratricopeptide (TPR) repeat protein
VSRFNPFDSIAAKLSKPSQSAFPPDDHESIPLTEAADRLVAKGIVLGRMGQSEEAMRLFEQALTLDEDNVEALLWRGGLSPANESLPYLERAVALDPSNQRARAGLDWARRRVGLATVASAAPAVAPVQRAAPRPRPANAPAPNIQIPDVGRSLLGAFAFLVERPTVALIIAMMLLGMLGTAAVARAGLSRSDANVAATPQSFVSTDPLPTPDKPAAATPAVSTAAKPAATPAATRPVTATVSTGALTLDQAWAANDWPQVLLIVDNMLLRSPGDPNLIKKKFAAHYNYGVQLVRNDRLAEAVAEFDKALAINANDTNVRGEKQFAQLYLEGSTALEKGDYGMAVRPLRMIYDGNPGYRQVKERLYRAYIGWAAQLEKENNHSEAYTYFQKAAKVDPLASEAQVGMTRLQHAAPAKPATASNKKIEVSLAKQQVTMWEGNKIIARFKASTGKDPYITRTGEFEILNKMPNAYSRALGWGMPYWMGIYQAGGTENGFHAMARLANGAVLGTGVLGRPATSGCIMVSDSDAKMLYNWADIGTPVIIQ